MEGIVDRPAGRLQARSVSGLDRAAEARVYCNDDTRNFHKKHGRTWLGTFSTPDGLGSDTVRWFGARVWMLDDHRPTRTYSGATGGPFHDRLVAAVASTVFREEIEAEPDGEIARERDAIIATMSTAHGEDATRAELAYSELMRGAQTRRPERFSEVWAEVAGNVVTERGARFSLSRADSERVLPSIPARTPTAWLLPVEDDDNRQDPGRRPLGYGFRCYCGHAAAIPGDRVHRAFDLIAETGQDEVSLSGLRAVADHLAKD